MDSHDSHIFYNGYNPNSATYIYNSAGESGNTDGQFLCEPYDGITLQIAIPVKGSTSIDVRIEGRVKGAGSARWANIWTKNYAAATTIDEVVVITEVIEYIRVGLKVNTNGTDSVTIIGGFKRTYGRAW